MLRQEGEYLARETGSRSMEVHVTAPSDHVAAGAGIAAIVFGSSALSTAVRTTPPPAGSWPEESTRAAPAFSYFSFERVLALYARHGDAPRLRWNSDVLRSAEQVRRRYAGDLVCVHLKYLPPYRVEESNADPRVWQAFFERHAVPGVLDFLLLGSDALPDEMFTIPGVSSAALGEVDLATQLCLVGFADGYLGTASGVATAANFSDVPHVLFKHPLHHPAEMERELGSSDRMVFASPNQLLWRRLVTPEALDEALAIVRR